MAKTVDKDRLTYIYTLSDPISKDVRYVGKTVKSLRVRLSGHIYSNKREHNHRINWINSILDKGLIPVITKIDECAWGDSQELEKNWIIHFREMGCNLVNSTDGGEGALGLKRSKEACLKSSRSIRNNSKIVYQYSKEGVFIRSYPSCMDAAEQTNSTSNNISQCCLLSKKSHNGYIWSYLSQNEIDFEKYKHSKPRGRVIENNSFFKKRVSVLITDLITNEQLLVHSIKDASAITGITTSNICNQCKHQKVLNGNYRFEYGKKENT